MHDDKFFTRALTNAEKAHLILYLLDNGLPDFGNSEDQDLVLTYCALTGHDYDVAKRAFIDASRFGMADLKGDLDA